MDGKEKVVQQLEKRARKELVQEKELLVLLLRMGQASGSWRRVSGGKESGKVSMSVTRRFFSFLWTGRRRRGWLGSWRREPGRS